MIAIDIFRLLENFLRSEMQQASGIWLCELFCFGTSAQVEPIPAHPGSCFEHRLRRLYTPLRTQPGACALLRGGIFAYAPPSASLTSHGFIGPLGRTYGSALLLRFDGAGRAEALEVSAWVAHTGHYECSENGGQLQTDSWIVCIVGQKMLRQLAERHTPVWRTGCIRGEWHLYIQLYIYTYIHIVWIMSMANTINTRMLMLAAIMMEARPK